MDRLFNIEGATENHTSLRDEFVPIDELLEKSNEIYSISTGAGADAHHRVVMNQQQLHDASLLTNQESSTMLNRTSKSTGIHGGSKRLQSRRVTSAMGQSRQMPSTNLTTINA